MERGCGEFRISSATLPTAAAARWLLAVAAWRFFVGPTTLMGGYYFIKSPRRQCCDPDSQFLIIQTRHRLAWPAAGFVADAIANSADSIATQSYLQSNDAMVRLDASRLYAAFSDRRFDPIQRCTRMRQTMGGGGKRGGKKPPLKINFPPNKDNVKNRLRPHRRDDPNGGHRRPIGQSH